MVTTKPHNCKRGDKNDDKSRKRKRFKQNYDYKVDYNDHFETPIEAYADILPLLDLIAPGSRKTSSTDDVNLEDTATIKARRKEHVIYDPYYCNGRTKTILRGLGFDKIVHEKRDFYKDIREGKVPNHHTLVTNPPYSDDHKERCLQFCVDQFREENIAFFLLIPNYVASRNYYRRILGDTIRDVAYLVPKTEYSYSHPEGTGHEESPFSSLWFCCIGEERIKELTQNRSYYWNADDGSKSLIGQPKFVASFDELVSLGTISLQNRPNPRQRKKMRKIEVLDSKNIYPSHLGQSSKKKKNSVKESKEEITRKKKGAKSKYRNADGERKKKRF